MIETITAGASTPIRASGYVEEWDGQFKVSRLNYMFPGAPGRWPIPAVGGPYPRDQKDRVEGTLRQFDVV